MGVSTKRRVEHFIERSSVKELLSKDVEQKLAMQFHQEHHCGGIDSWEYAKEYVAVEHTYSFLYIEVAPILDMLADELYKRKAYGVREDLAYQIIKERTILNDLMARKIINIFFYNAEKYGR